MQLGRWLALTPALSPGEGVAFATVPNDQQVVILVARGKQSFPLLGERVRVRAELQSHDIYADYTLNKYSPWGEGKGEGECKLPAV